MATTEPASEPAPADEVAASCRDADLVGLVGAPRGDALAAVGLLANALEAVGVPFQATLDREGATGGTEADATVTVGVPDAAATHGIDPGVAARVAAALGRPGPVLSLTAAPNDETVAGDAPGLERRPGLAVPTADPVDGLAHSTLVHGPFSGDADAARAVLGVHDDGTDEAARRERASAVVLSVGAASPPASRAGTAVERVLRPHAGGPLETVEGYADVLDALARRDPGRGLATVLGELDADAALSAWRDHARAVHAAVAAAELRHHDWLAVAEVEASATAVEPVARLLRDFRSTEPAVLVVGPDRTALATGPDRNARTTLGEHAPVDGHPGVASTGSTVDETAVAASPEGER